MNLGRSGRSRRMLALAGALCASPVAAQVDCNGIALQIATLERSASASGSANARAAAQKQQAQLQRTIAYARSIGCDRPQFLFFGDRPPQCEGINAQIQRMQASVGQLQREGVGDGGLKRQLQNQYEVYCRGAQREPNFLERLFGGPADRTYPPEPGDRPLDDQPEETRTARGGPMAVCVRSCDGGFFPVSYSARRGDLGQLQELCTALCPNTEVKLYTRTLSRDMNSAVSADGEAYPDMPNAFKYEKAIDKTCTCRPPGKTWVEALADAEQILGNTRQSDIVVTPEKAEELSRPKPPGATPQGAAGRKPKFDPQAALRLLDERKAADAQSEAERAAAAQAPTAGAESSGIDAGKDKTSSISRGELRETPAPDGSSRKMRVLGQ